MIRKAFKTCAAGLAAGLGLLGGALPAMGQTPPTTGVPGDWPNLGAFNNRQGRNVSPFGYNSGQTQLRYLVPGTVQERNSLVLDNTDLRANEFSNGGQYDDPQYSAPFPAGYSATNPPLSYASVSSIAAWPVPLQVDYAASTIDIPAIRVRESDGTRVRSEAARPTEYFSGSTLATQYPSYNYAFGVPSDPAGDGTTAVSGTTASYFQWKFVPSVGNARTFALYAALPVGPTRPNAQSNYLYPQRYFVYEIRFGPDRDGNGIPDNRIVDILDTETAANNGGYVRLGVTGSETSTYFPASGDTSNSRNPSTIQVRLYNTVPRDTMVPSVGTTTGRLLVPNPPLAGANTEAAAAAQRLVYADAARITPFTGTYAASPTTTTISGNTANGLLTTGAVSEDLTADWNLTLARTTFAYNFTNTSTTSTSDEGATVNGTLQLGTDGAISNFEANPSTTGTYPFDTTNFQPYQKWQYSLSSNQVGTTTLDNTSAGVTATGGFTAQTVNPNHVGANYLRATAATTSSESVTYKPDLADGDYDIYAYVPGNSASPAETYATNVLYQIYQGTTVVYSGTLDESKAQGWVHLGGSGRFANTQTALPNEPLSVVIYNQAASATGTNYVYADAVRFVGQANSGFTSTPVHATVAITPQGGGTPVDTKVVLVADDNGVLHCLDEAGRSDGTTTEYWSYPSTPDGTTTYKDPNIWSIVSNGSGIDGVPNPASTTAPYDNTPTAVMPTGFDLSTAAIARVPITTANGNTTYEDRLYVGSTNGRVYCINMAGRGDYSATNRTVGSTQRRWTFPDDYDPSTPTAPSGTGTVGAFRGSVTFGYPSTTVSATPTPADLPTLYVGTTQGRVYALDAVGDGTTTHTTARWQFPLAGQSNLPAIRMTPTLFSPTKVTADTTTNRLLFGTQIDTTTEGPGQFYCLSAATGVPYWAYRDQRTTAQGRLNDPDARVTNTGLAGFVASPVAVPYATLDLSPTTLTQGMAVRPAHFDTVYTLNQNGYLFGLNVDNGFLISDQGATGQENANAYVYITNALNATTSQNLSFTFATTYVANATNATTGLQTYAMIVIPGDDGVLSMVAARPEDHNEDSDLTTDVNFPTATYDYRAIDPFTLNDVSATWTSAAASNNFLFANASDGVGYAFDNVGGTNTTLNPFVDTGGAAGISPNDPRADAFKNLRVRLINKKGYALLKTVVDPVANQGPLTHDDAVNRTAAGGDLSKNSGTTSTATGESSNPYGFEWGETAYIFVYNFPYADHPITVDGSGNATYGGANIEQPTVSVQISIEGRILRTPTARAMKFAGTTNTTVGTLPADGYAVLPYAFNSTGTSALPPGTGRMTASITTSALTGSDSVVNQPRRGGSTIFFVVANPLAVAVYNPTTGAYSDSIGVGTNNVYLTNGAAPENAVNGTPAIGAQGTYAAEPLKAQLHASAQPANHGSSTTARVSVYDRSLSALLHEDGLANFRVTRSNLQRQGGYQAVFQRLNLANPLLPVDPSTNPSIYPGFEDRPTTDGTNNSLDYPDMGREQVRALLGVNGTTENPIGVASTLSPPKVLLSDNTTPLLNANNYDQGTRLPQATPLDITIDVPRYQPPVYVQLMNGYSTTNTPVTLPDGVKDLTNVRHDSLGYQIPYQGYFARVTAFIDSNNDNKLTQDTNVEVYRAFNISTNVLPQSSLLVGSPTVDLGSLASGTGYAPLDPANAYTSTGFASPFSPWSILVPNPSNASQQIDRRDALGLPNWSTAYRSIVVRNDGNVNMLDLRLAKATANNGNTAQPWALPTADNDPLAWMTATLRGGITSPLSGGVTNDGNLNAGDLWSNFDSTFAAQNRFNGGRNYAILPKARVTDRVPTELVANPYPRANPNLALNASGGEVVKGTAGSRLVDGSATNRLDIRSNVPSSAPKVAVSVPLGFPVGSYSAQIRVVDNVPLSATAPFASNDILELLNNSSEVYSDPITLTYKVRETRMTNGQTARTAPFIDALVANANGTALVPTTYRNSAPTALRTLTGDLYVAWESDRAVASGTSVINAPNPSRIYLSTEANGAGQNGGLAPADNPPLWDLSQFDNTKARWFGTGAAYPDSGKDNGLFPGGTLVPNTATYGSPSFPQRGAMNPLDNPANASTRTSFGTVDLGFVGEAQVQTGGGRVDQSRVFLTTANSSGVLGPNPIDMGGDPQTKKGKPSVLQLSDSGGSGIPGAAIVFFSETSAGQSGITASRLIDGKPVPVPLGFGDGFSSVFSPSANARQYLGADPTLKGLGSIVDLSFAGKLRGRANAEVYLGRLRLNASTGGLVDGGGNAIENANAGSPFALLPQQSNERALGEGNGVYRTRGVNWSRTSGVTVTQTVLDPTSGAVVQTDLLVAATRAVDRQSGIVSYDSRLGGKAYIDPSLGTIRFAGGFPNRNAEIRVSYQPYFLRVTPGGTAGYSAVNGLWDDHYALDYAYDPAGNRIVVAPSYWYTGSNDYMQSPGNSDKRDGMRNDRYVFAYGRGAAGGGVTARPYTTTMRLGIRLPTRVATDNQGNVVEIQVSTTAGNLHPYQVDPANGRVYLMAEDEDKPITVTYRGVNEATNQPTVPITVQANASFVLERTETPVAVDEAANDSALSAFVDPFTSTATPRPPLYWLFYVSTRAGGPDLYFQSIAPRYTPFAK